MTVKEMKEYARRIVAAYFGDSHVFFADQKKSKGPTPYLTVKILGNSKNRSKITKYDSQEECFKDYWQVNSRMEVNLYSLGENVAPKGREPVYENTTIEDLSEFVKYLESDAISDSMVLNDVVIALDGEIRDVSFLLRESEYRYRAMAEFKISFTDSSYGAYGQNDIPKLPNASGGGSEDMVQDTETIESINITGGYEV